MASCTAPVQHVSIPKHTHTTLKNGIFSFHKFCLPQSASSNAGMEKKVPQLRAGTKPHKGPHPRVFLSLPISSTTKWSGWLEGHWITFCSKGSKPTPNPGKQFYEQRKLLQRRALEQKPSFTRSHSNRPSLAFWDIPHTQEKEQVEKEGCRRPLGRSAPQLTQVDSSEKASGGFSTRINQNGCSTLFPRVIKTANVWKSRIHAKTKVFKIITGHLINIITSHSQSKLQEIHFSTCFLDGL